jgi:hypothetical protein
MQADIPIGKDLPQDLGINGMMLTKKSILANISQINNKFA